MTFIPANDVCIRPSLAATVLLLVLVGFGCNGSCQGMSPPPADRASPRLATLTPSLTAIAVHLGAEKHLVGVSKHGPQVPGVPVVAGVHPNIEGVLFVEPDVVAIGRFPSNAADITKLEAAKLDVRTFGVVTLADLRASTLAMGKLLGRETQGDRFAAALDNALEQATNSAMAKRGARVLVVYGRSGGSFYSTGGGDHIADILAAFKATNIAAGGPVSVRLSMERILHLAPDTILHVVKDPEMPTQEAALAYWRKAAPTLPAVKLGRIIVWSDGSLALNGPNIVPAITELGRRLQALPQ